MVRQKISNLLKRTISSLIAIPLVFLIIYDKSGLGFSFVILLFALLSIYEISSMSDTSLVLNGLLHGAVVLVLFLSPARVSYVFFPIVWAFLIYEIINHPKRRACFWLYNIVLAYTWFFALKLWLLGSVYLVHALLFIWCIDSVAFLGGYWMGQVPLWKSVSPNKTVEGAACAIIIGVLWPFMPLKGGIVALASVYGDLVESRLKRLAGCKDSGNFLPGHGGLLDRIDSVTAGLPLYFFFLLFGVN